MSPINTRPLVIGLSCLSIVLGINGCNGGNNEPATTTNQPAETPTETSNTDNRVAIVLPFENNVSVNGAGASFPAPLYQGWFAVLSQQVPQLRFNFQSVGSGAGIQQFTNQIVDFAASDIAMTDEQIAEIERGVLMLPMTAGSIVVAYNLPGVDNLNLSREALAGIFLGEITNWNDPKIAAANPDVELPNQNIVVVFRSDGSGTTSIFTNYLSAISPKWKEQVGSGTAVQWPTGVGGRGNEGVVAGVRQSVGAIGYMEYGFAKNNNLVVASLENQAGNFIMPTDESGTETLSQVELPENLRAFITDPEGDNSYPIVTYTWMLLYQKYDSTDKPVALEAMIQFGLNEGQEQAVNLGYIKLPDNVRQKVAEAADQLTPDFDIQLQEFSGE